MVTGAAMAGAKEISFNLLGCFWVMVCSVSTAAYLILIKLQKEKLGEFHLQALLAISRRFHGHCGFHHKRMSHFLKALQQASLI